MENLKIETEHYQDLSFFSENDIKQININKREHLQDLIHWAIMSKKTLYPVSSGYNWGMGSKRPTSKESIVVHLAGLNQIYDYDAEMGTVVIDPGVTQKQLAEFLKAKNSKYFLDTTGSSKDTSVMGNALERGISYNALRCEKVLGLEVLTGKGEFIKTGSWRLKGAKTYNTYSHGIGADLTSLFFQSNFGIVTKMVYKLQLRKKYNHAVELKFNHIKDIYACLNNFSSLMQEGQIDSIFHIANTERAKNAILPYIQKVCHESNFPFNYSEIVGVLNKAINTPWISTGMLSSNDKKILKYRKKILKKALSPYAKVRFFNIDHLLFLQKFISKTPLKILSIILKASFPFRYLYFGNPTDAALGSIMSEDKFIFSKKNLAKQVKDTDCGFSYCLPLTRMDKESCENMVQIIEDISKNHNFDPSITLNPINASTIEAVVSLSYIKFNAKKAHKCIREMQEELNKNGHYSYRTNIRDMDLYSDSSTEYYKHLQEIKNSFDPHGIISPGRYLA